MSDPWIRWSSIIQITESRFVSLAWPAFSIIPLLAVVLSLFREVDASGQSLALLLFGEKIASIIKNLHYPSLLFFWYFAYLFFWIGAISARAACPERIQRHRRFDAYLRFIGSSQAMLKRRSDPGYDPDDDDGVGSTLS